MCFITWFIFCDLKYEPCDKTQIGIITNQIKDQNGPSLNYNNALTSGIRLLTLMTIPSGPCSEGDNPPSVTRHIPDVTLHMCSAFKYEMKPNTFTDLEDGNNLQFVLTSLNNVPIDETTTWIYGTAEKTVLATVSNNVYQTSTSFKINVRGYDKKQQYADTNWNIHISGHPKKVYHSYKLTLTPKVQSNQAFKDKYRVAMLTNKYFGGNITNIISLEYQNSGRTILFTFSSCALPEYCDPNGAGDYLSRLQRQGYKDQLSTDYVLTGVNMQSDDVCNGPLNPPTPSRIAWDLEVGCC